MGDIFPCTAAHDLALHLVGVFDCGVVAVFGVEVVCQLRHALGESRRGPFADVAGHVVEAEVVGRVCSDARRYKVAVLNIVAFLRLEVGVEAAFLFGQRQIALPWIHVLVVAGAGCELPFGFGRQAVGLYVDPLAAQRAAQEVGAPVGESVGLLPADSDNGIFVIAAVAEVEAHVRLVVGVLEIVDPCRRVGVDVDDIGVEEIVVACQAARYRLTHDLAFVVDPGGVFRDHRIGRRNRLVGVVFATARIEAVLALGSLGVVEDFVAVVELRGVIDANDRTFIGKATPDFTLGWNNTLSWKNWDLNVFFTGAFGADRLNLVRYTGAAITGDFAFITLKEAWENSFDKLGQAARYPSVKVEGNNYQAASTKWLESADYFRLDNISLSYNLPKKVAKFADLRFTFSCQNLFTITGYKGMDPAGISFMDTSNGSVDINDGIDMGAYPLNRTYTIGVRMNF